jgi:hypothetical protein
MKDVVRATEQAALAAEQVRASVVDLRAVLEGDAPQRSIAQIEATTTATIGELRATGITLILTFFGALLAYRVALLLLRKGAKPA